MKTICMKCQNLFYGKNKKNIINVSSAEFAQRVVKVKVLIAIEANDILCFYYFFFLYFSEKIRLGISCELSVRQMTHMKSQVLFSLNNDFTKT